MGKKSKPKGGRGEREICAKMTEVFNGPFIRSANSGAFVGGKNASRRSNLSDNQLQGLKGDIVPPDFMPRLVIESKLYAEFSYHLFVAAQPIPLLDDWLGQTLDASDPGDFWMLAFRADRRAWACAFDASLADRFVLPDVHIRYKSRDGLKCIIANLDEFITMNRDVILELTK